MLVWELKAVFKVCCLCSTSLKTARLCRSSLMSEDVLESLLEGCSTPEEARDVLQAFLDHHQDLCTDELVQLEREAARLARRLQRVRDERLAAGLRGFKDSVAMQRLLRRLG